MPEKAQHRVMPGQMPDVGSIHACLELRPLKKTQRGGWV
jgi:hypothetical protein